MKSLKSIQWGEELQLPTSRGLLNSTHFVGGKYPCRSIAFIPRMIIENFAEKSSDLKVLDPFMGSGTTAVEAGYVSSVVYGVEIDPYARLIATASTTPLSQEALDRVSETIRDALVEAPKSLPEPKFQPLLKNVNYWFEDSQFEDLLKLKTFLLNRQLPESEENLLLSAFGDIIRACSKAERQSLKPYISSRFTKPTKPVFAEFDKIATKYLNAVEALNRGRFAGIEWIGDDATDFQTEHKIDLAITSPPYINAMDYTRCIKLESAWIGTANDQSLRKVKAGQLGEVSRRHLSSREGIRNLCFERFGELQQIDSVRFDTVVAFFADMDRNLKSVRKSLKSGGSYFLIVGNSTIRGVEVATHEVLAELGNRNGFAWSRYFHYKIRDHRTSIPRGERGGKINVEHIIGLTAN